MRRIGDSNLFVMPAGEPVVNPLELLHLKRVRRLMNSLRNAFRWILLDSPSLAPASDANLLAALADGTLLVARMGATTPDSMSSRHRIWARTTFWESSPTAARCRLKSLCGSRPL